MDKGLACYVSLMTWVRILAPMCRCGSAHICDSCSPTGGWEAEAKTLPTLLGQLARSGSAE